MKGNKIFDFSRVGFQQIINTMTGKINEVVEVANEMFPRLDEYISKVDWNKIINSDLYQSVIGDLDKTNEQIENINSKLKNRVEINLLDIGCNFEEGKDDSDLIQKAINEGNIIVFPPNKIAYIKKPLYAKSDLTIIGNGSTIKWENETIGLEDKGIIDLQQGIYNNVTIEDLIIDGNKRGNSHIPDHTYNTTSSNGMDCIRGGTINNLLIKNCTFKDSQKMGIVINGYGENITVLNSIVDKATRDGIFIVGKNVLISNCKLKNTRDNSIAFDCDFVEDTSKVGNFIVENCVIENTEKLSNECGIYIGGLPSKTYAKNFEIKGNTIIGQTYHGLIVKNVDTVNIHDNIIKDCLNNGGLTSHGVSLKGCKNIYINKNRISYNQGSGVQSTNNINTYLSDNIINNNTLTGIYIDSGEAIEIINNSLCDNGAESDSQCGNIVIGDLSNIGSPQQLVIKNNTLRKETNVPYYGISIKSSAINNVQIIENNNFINLIPIFGTYVDWIENTSNDYSYTLDFSKAKKHKLKLYQDLGSLSFSNGCVGEKYTLILDSKGGTRTLNFGNLIITSSVNKTLNADCFSMYEIIFDGSKYICTNKVENYF